MLRHTFATRCYWVGLNPIKIRDILGHESIDITINTYTHDLNNEQKIIEKMKEYLKEFNLIWQRFRQYFFEK